MTGTARTLARAGLLVTAAYLGSRVLGWVRLVVISSVFGANADLDAYFAAFRIPDLIFQLVAAGALSSALIPVLAHLVTDAEEERAWRVVTTVINLMLLVLLGLSVLLALGAPLLMPVLTPGFDAVQIELTVRLSRIMLLSPVLLALAAVATSVLNAHGRFGASAIAPLFYNGLIILAAVLLTPAFGVEGLAIGVVLGSLAHLAVQLPTMVRLPRFAYDFRVDLRDPAAREALLLMAPRAIGLGAVQLTLIIHTTLASALGTGAIVAYNIAFTVMQIPIGVIGIPLAVVLLPSMSRAFASGNHDLFGQLAVRSLRLSMYVMFFLTAMTMVLRREVLTLLFDYGNFDARAIDLTANTLLFFAAGLVGYAAVFVLAPGFYAGKDTRTPVGAAILYLAATVVVSVVSVGTLGLSGLALGTSIGAWLEAGMLLVLLARRTRGLEVGKIVTSAVQFAIGAAVAGAAAFATLGLGRGLLGAVDPSKVVVAVQVTLAGLAGLAAYVAFSAVVRIPELGGTVGLLRTALRRGQRGA
ncbi:MAG: murein biosynthesis integral membrane protein MurJ [Candidatus Limnocylindrales bacterium]